MWKPRLSAFQQLQRLDLSLTSVEVLHKVARISTLPINSDSDLRRQRQRNKISEILTKVHERDGVRAAPPNIQYLIGRASSGGNNGENASDNLDIADKTQLILQSSHPVRYIVERELTNFKHQRSQIPTQLTYHDWITIFGRSLISPKSLELEEKQKFETQLYYVSNAAEAGMFSSDNHQTVVNIPINRISDPRLLAQLHLGNKYAVLVGDFFAIKAIYFAEKTKNNQVLLCVTQGVEDFASAPYFSNLVNSSIWIPSVPTLEASLRDWADYNVKASGYFAGGLEGVLKVLPPSFQHLTRSRNFNQSMRQLVQNFTLFVKLGLELKDFENEREMMASPFLLVSLPAVLFQAKNPQAFNFLRRPVSSKKDGLGFNFDDLMQIRDEISRSDALSEANSLMKVYGNNCKEALAGLGQDDFYISIFNELIDAFDDESHLSVFQESPIVESPPLQYPMQL